MYNEIVIGICSLCGGEVVIPLVYNGMTSPEPICRNCGAIKSLEFMKLPVIQMRPKMIGTTPRISDTSGVDIVTNDSVRITSTKPDTY